MCIKRQTIVLPGIVAFVGSSFVFFFLPKINLNCSFFVSLSSSLIELLKSGLDLRIPVCFVPIPRLQITEHTHMRHFWILPIWNEFGIFENIFTVAPPFTDFISSFHLSSFWFFFRTACFHKMYRKWVRDRWTLNWKHLLIKANLGVKNNCNILAKHWNTFNSRVSYCKCRKKTI